MNDEEVVRLIQARILTFFAAVISLVNGLVVFGAVSIPREITGAITFGEGLLLWIASAYVQGLSRTVLRILAIFMAVWLGFLAFYH